MEIEIGYTEISEETISVLKESFELFELIDAEDEKSGQEFGFAEIDGEIVGAVQYVGNRIFLIQSKPGTGAGKALIDALVEEFESEGALYFDNALPGVQEYYRRLGAEPIGNIRGSDGGQDFVLWA
jgi:GNAT superfamily N-acetyltransferase